MSSISIVEDFISMVTENFGNLGKETGFIKRESNLKAITFTLINTCQYVQVKS